MFSLWLFSLSCYHHQLSVVAVAVAVVAVVVVVVAVAVVVVAVVVVLLLVLLVTVLLLLQLSMLSLLLLLLARFPPNTPPTAPIYHDVPAIEIPDNIFGRLGSYLQSGPEHSRLETTQPTQTSASTASDHRHAPKPPLTTASINHPGNAGSAEHATAPSRFVMASMQSCNPSTADNNSTRLGHVSPKRRVCFASPIASFAPSLSPPPLLSRSPSLLPLLLLSPSPLSLLCRRCLHHEPPLRQIDNFVRHSG